MRTTLIAVLATFSLPSMAEETAPQSLDGSAWKLTALASEMLLDDVTATLLFESGHIAGTDGCNRFRGAYDYDDGELRIGRLSSTMMACPDPVMRQGLSYTGALERARRATLEDESLVLLDSDGEMVARFEPQPQTLVNTRWDVTSYNNGKQAVVSTEQGSSLSLEFDDAGSAIGSAGCNRFRAAYSVDGKSVRFSEPAATRRLCEEALMTQERAFLKALEHSSRFRVEADRLELRDDDGALQVAAILAQ